MESNFHNTEPGDASAQLDAISADRRQLAQRVVRTPWWYIPASTFLGTAIVASPATESVWAVTMTAAIATLALVGVENAVRKHMGLVVTRPVGPRGLLLSIGLGVAILALFATSVALAAVGLGQWILATVAGAIILIPVGLWVLDRVMGLEIERAR